ELIRDPDHDVDEADALQTEIEEHERRLGSLQRTARALATPTQEQQQQRGRPGRPAIPALNNGGGGGRRPLGIPIKDVTPGDLLARAMVCKFVSQVTHRSLEDVLQERYPDHEATAVVTRAAVTGATTLTP